MQKALTALAPVAPARRATHSLARHARAALRPTACALAVAAALAAPAAHAVTYNWVGSSTNGLWSTGSNWAGTVVPPSNGLASADIVFGASAFRATILQAAYSVLSLSFSAAAGAYSFSGAPLTVGAGGISHSSSAAQSFAALVVVGAAQTWTLASGSGDLSFSSGVTLNNALTINAATTGGSGNTITGVLSGSGSLTKTGAGTLTLSSPNTTAGTTTISAGTLAIVDGGGGGGSLGSGSVVNNATLLFNRNTASTLANAISGSGNLVKTGTGTLTLTGANTTTGTTTISAGTLAIGDGGSLGSVNPGNVVNNAALLFNGNTSLSVANAISGTGSLTQSGSGTLTLTGANTSTGTTRISAGSLVVGDGGGLGTGAVVNDSTLRFDRSTPLTFANAISGAGSLVKAGTGTLTLTGASSYGGDTTIIGGTLAVANNGILSGGDLNVNAGATLAISGFAQVNVGSGLSLNVSGFPASPAAVVLAGNGSVSATWSDIGRNGTGSFTQTGGSHTAGVLGVGESGRGTYTISGGTLSTGTMFLGDFGASTFTQTGGTVVVTNGIVFGEAWFDLQNTYLLSGGTLTTPGMRAVSAAQNASFNFNGGTLRAGASNTVFLQGLGAANVRAGGARIDTNGFDITVAQPLLHDAGAGATDGGLTKLGSGTLTLTGSGSFAGGTRIEAGTLLIGDGARVGAGNVVNSAALVFDNSASLSFANAISGTGSVTKTGAGTATLTGANTYTGRTSVRGGSLEVASGGSLDGNNVAVEAGGTLAISGSGQVNTGATVLYATGSAASPGAVLLSGNGRLSTARTYIGFNGSGSMTQTGGAHTTGELYLGAGSSGDIGTYLMRGGTLNATRIRLGYDGAGILTQSGGTVTADEIVVLNFNGATVASGLVQLNGGTLAINQISRTNDNTATFNFNGGTLQARSGTASFLQGLTAANVQAGGARIDSNGFDITIGQALLHDASSGAIDGGITKLGSGTLTLSGSNTFNGALNIAAGTLAVADDAALGASPLVTVGGGGRLLFTGSATTARNYSLGSATLAVAGGSTLSLANGASINGGFLAAGGTFAFAGGSSMSGSTAGLGSTITTAGAVAFNNTTLRGSTTVGSGSVLTASNNVLSSAGTLAVNGRINADYLESNGVTTINSGGTLSVAGGRVVLGGGSRTTINAGGTLAAVSPFANASSIELNGALLVNNGTQTGNLNINFGAVAKGAGIFGNVSVGSGGTFAPGNSPGTATVQNFTFGSGGAYEFELNRATGTPGVNSDLLRVIDTLSVAASNTPGNRFTISIVSLNASNGPAPLADFNASMGYSFLLVDAAQISGYAFDKFNIDSSRFLNNTQGGQFSLALDAANSDLYLVYAPVPEPATWLTMVLGAAGLGVAVRRRQNA